MLPSIIHFAFKQLLLGSYNFIQILLRISGPVYCFNKKVIEMFIPSFFFLHWSFQVLLQPNQTLTNSIHHKNLDHFIFSLFCCWVFMMLWLLSFFITWFWARITEPPEDWNLEKLQCRKQLNFWVYLLAARCPSGVTAKQAHITVTPLPHLFEVFLLFGCIRVSPTCSGSLPNHNQNKELQIISIYSIYYKKESI